MTNLTNRPTSPPNRAALPDGWVDRLFVRLHAMYGKAWLDMWADAPIPTVKALWAESLGRCTAEQIRLALLEIEKGGKAFPPTLPEFVAVCEQFRPKGPPSLYLAAPRTEAPANVFANLRQQLEAKR